MANYERSWTEAKAAFEASTGIAKPAPQGKIPIIRINYRKGTGVDSAFKRIDRLIPTDVLGGAPESDLAKLQTEYQELHRKANQYLTLLDAGIQVEKTGAGGKVNSPIYRDLKILKSTLLSLVAMVKLDINKLAAANRAEGSRKTKMFEIAIRTASEGLASAAREGLAWAQGLLKDPNAHDFNNLIERRSRNITQQLGNLRKWAMPGELSEGQLASRTQNLADGGPGALSQAVQDLHAEVVATGLKDAVLALLIRKGSTSAVNASLEEMGNGANMVKLPRDASPAEARQAIKHYMSMAKAALEISERMKGQMHGFGNQVNIPEALRVDPRDIPPDFEAPAPPPRAVAPPPVAGRPRAGGRGPLPPRRGRGPLPQPPPAGRKPLPPLPDRRK